MNYEKLVDLSFDELVESLRKICSFNSKLEQSEPNAPFGKTIRACLDEFLALGESFGFDTYNCDGYAGHVEWKGKTEQSVGILGHLDIIPADDVENWICHPFKGEIKDGKLYARGAMDDKGPVVSCLYAMKLLKDNGYVPEKSIRVIVGCDEETGMRGIKYYLTKQNAPTFSFTPDGDFPVIHAEKGILHCEINCGKIDERILSLTAGTRANVVCDHVKIVLSKSLRLESENRDENGNPVFEFFGKSAHASTPEKGENATWSALKFLAEVFPCDKAFEFLSTKLCDHTGKSFGIDFSDEYSKLTCNIGVLQIKNGELIATIDCRFPVSMTLDKFFSEFCARCPYPVKDCHSDNPLFVDDKSFLVQTLLSVYNQATNRNDKALVIGGGTYSKCMPNCVAFGPLFLNEEQTIHMPNERIDLENLKKMTVIYMKAIEKLSN